MDSDIIKKLKDAGFPQKSFPFWQEGYVPNLNELIEACEPGFTYLMKLTLSGKNEWMAKWEFHDNIENREVSCKGYNREVAVANLWLKLNQ